MAIQLSPQQRKAIEAPLGPVLVVAGPGAGKTHCLISRIGHVAGKLAVPPEQICAVTFTNKAAEEIAHRLADELGPRTSTVHRGTIHALCAEILREHGLAAGLKPGFGIADEDYQRTVIRQLGQGRRDSQLLKLFCRRRLQEYRLTAGDEQLFLDYQAVLRRRNLIDFDDLLTRTARLFEERADIARDVAARWRYLLVDEFQDVNPVQYAVLRRLAEPHRNIFAVGDDEQSIFSWTGADPGVLGRFQRDYSASPIVLDRNHRCSQQVFAAARRLLAANPTLFDKELRATRLSLHEVKAIGFEDDEQEAAWLIADIAADREAFEAANPGSPLEWGDYAVLYRKHETGARLESHLLRHGVPCRLARGRPLADDRVIGPVVTAMRLIRDPSDTAAAQSFAGRVLPDHLMHRVESEVRGADDFLLAVRDMAGAMPAGDPDTKKLWRLIYQVENLAAMRGRHTTLAGLINELLEQRLAVYKNVLEDRHEDLVDPADMPESVLLSRRLAAARRGNARVVIEAMGGLEIALRGMLFAAGFKRALYRAEVVQAELDDLALSRDDAGPAGLAVTLFKALQLVSATASGGRPRRYVTFDLETTGKETTSCGIIEIAAVRVVDGMPAGEFHALVNPGMPIEPEATRLAHGYRDADVAGSPAFAAVWPAFCEFAGGDMLVAHNGHDFDLPVLRRHAAAAGWTDAINAYDTLPLARSLGGGSARLTALAERFGIAVGRAHHALDDARMLAAVFEELERRRVVRSRKAALVNALAWLGLALAIEQPGARDETAILFDVSRMRTLGRFSDALEFYDAERTRVAAHGPSLDEVIERLGGRRRMEALRAERDAASLYPDAVARLAALIEQHDGELLDAAIERFLERVALSAAAGADVGRGRVNLLTLHSTKGLEFSRVYIVGVEDAQLPGYVSPDDDPAQAMQEARRLLYVGMTRSSDRLVLTRVERRNGKPAGGSGFLEEIGLTAERLELLPTP